MTLKLHNYFRSSTSTRLRAALNLKGLAYEYLGVHLPKGAHRDPDYTEINPQGLVPALELEDGTVLTQSLAIMEWLDEAHPARPLLPAEPKARARVRALGQMIALEIHPINNLRVLTYIDATFGAGDSGKRAWVNHWVHTTFAPLEQMLAGSDQTGTYCHGETPGYADCCLYAQMWNNARFEVDMSPYPVIRRIHAALDELPAFADAAPGRQPDAL
ncbi:maleylacetoacetate isomerase [Sinisalibacter aestuarii]|uniref:Maleylacetoacetate isomerase n=1 Tax=Sinisalibacter aestuarii TaxID=2949426 RepID=A0ABQ5LSN2_9RHOB|nr:maleylacetoacetate isomerase [Sinisalibacter aestuarii]GKY88005.1 maleylacetoacetate isomerase [Sinisalibacter aestuarii]